MKPFMDKDFLLRTETARHLYHTYAAEQPIIDYHCHLSPREIAEDKRYNNITEVWLYGDHYKWRAMRSCGISEEFITGDASDYEKFRAYCTCMPKLIGNPLYHWSHLELRRFFDCDLIINEENCDAIWTLTAEKLADPKMSARNLIVSSGVKMVGTTDDPADSLEYHKQLQDEGFATLVAPSFRPDKGLAINKKGIREYICALGKANGVEIIDYATLLDAYRVSLDRFCALGCRAADHALDNFRFVSPDEFHAKEIFARAMEKDGKGIIDEETALFRCQMLRFFGQEYVKRGMVMQLHFGVYRNPNGKMLRALGPDTGYDIIHGESTVAQFADLLNYLDNYDGLPRTILYSLNGADNDAVATLCGAFAGADYGEPRVVQGSAWWFQDRLDGMRAQMRSFAGLASLGNFLGMLTDSRSFLSYPRHEYFRRILCDLLGEWVENGEYPNDEQALAAIVEGICYGDAKRYFGL
ncbi:MAG: glucuronate isomerase [Clostridia bacterium]|nr:glucuronate isomerase [Clostridia bacterium]